MKILKIKNIVACKSNIWDEVTLKCACTKKIKVDLFENKKGEIELSIKRCPFCHKLIFISRKDLISKRR